MQKLALLIAMIISTMVQAQNYEEGMQKAFELWGQNQTTEASNLFERIANAEQDNWLPAYYAANINVLSSFGEQDKEKLTAKLDKAKELLGIAKAISPNNPELMAIWAEFLNSGGIKDISTEPVLEINFSPVKSK